MEQQRGEDRRHPAVSEGDPLAPSLPRSPYGPGLLLMLTRLAAHSHRGPGGAYGALQIGVGPAEVAWAV